MPTQAEGSPDVNSAWEASLKAESDCRASSEASWKADLGAELARTLYTCGATVLGQKKGV